MSVSARLFKPGRFALSSPRLFAASLFLVAIGACNKQDEAADAEDAPKPVVKTADRGPVKLTVTASRDKATIAERVDLLILVEADKGIEVRMPDFGLQGAGLQIDDFQQPPADELPDGRTRHRQTYELEAFVSGEYSIPSITAKYIDRRDATDHEASEQDAVQGELSTEPFNIRITSLLEGEFDPQGFRDVKGVATLAPDRTWAWLWWVTGGLLGCGALIFAIVLLVKQARRPARIAVIPPHEWALQQLRELVRAQLVENGQIKAFYYRLNQITRTYIELRFGLMAPERTTEEFLAELRGGSRLPADHRDRLEAFLEACDMVKYALYKPGAEEIEQVFNTARDFVMETSPNTPQPRGAETASEAAA